MGRSGVSPRLIKWIGTIVIVYIVLDFLGSNWDRITAGGMSTAILVLGVLLLLLGGGVVFGRGGVNQKGGSTEHQQ